MKELLEIIQAGSPAAAILKMNLNKTEKFKEFLKSGGDVDSYFKGYEEGVVTAAFLLDLVKKPS